MKTTYVLIKSIVFTFPILILLFMTACSNSGPESSMYSNVQPGYNLDDLNSYGEWVNLDNYGEVWRPYAVNSWMPFDNGHWAYANANWTWISYEPFGWIVYHYGYWYDDPFYGWVWIPSDGIWSPANVMWINYGVYVGWAPLPPRGVLYGQPWETNQNQYWHVVKTADFTKDNIRDYRVVNPVRNENGSRGIINTQPDRTLVEKTIGRPIPEVSLQREAVKPPVRNIERMDLPQQENQRVQQNSTRVRKEVLIPRDEFKKQQKERNNPKK
jgi:hypothetical protein